LEDAPHPALPNMTQTQPVALEIDPPDSADASVILLHGLGADGNDFVPLVPELDLGDRHNVRFIFPHAPPRAVTVNGGMVMPAWYDIVEVDITAQPDEQGIRTSAQQLTHMVDRERERGIGAERIVVAGFSQGGAIALVAGLRYPRRLAGIVALSTYLPLADSLDHEAAAANRDVPIFMGHGLFDPVVPFIHGSRSCRRLEEMGYPAALHSYRVEHAINYEEITDMGDWLRRVLQL